MTCRSIEEILVALARESRHDLVAPAMRVQALVHIESCTECAQKFHEQRKLSRRLHQTADEMKALRVPARIEHEVKRAFSEQFSAPPAPAIGNKSHWLYWAAAAAIIAAIGITAVTLHNLRRSIRPEMNEAANIQPVVTPVINSAEEPAPSSTPNRKATSVNRGNRFRKPSAVDRNYVAKRKAGEVEPGPSAPEVQNEIATSFMPIGFGGGPINAQDGGQLVRVALSRSAMLSLGLPVNMDRLSESLKADILLGPDGLPRAIRFVQ